MTGVMGALGRTASNAMKQLVAYGEAGALIGGGLFVGHEILEYGKEISNLSAVTGAAGSQLEEFKSQIDAVALATRTAAPDVAKAFTAVDNNMPELHKDAAALAEVTKQSIILARASRMELGDAAEALTLSMNQFGMTASEAGMAIDALSAGAVVGSSRIAETSEALQVFGTVAKNVAHVTYSESVALVELASKFEKGSEAGTRLRNILLDMTNIKFSPAADKVKALGVNLDIVANRSLPFEDRFKELSKIKDNAEAMEKLFDKRNVAVAAGLFTRVDEYQKILDATSKVGGAQDMATTNMDNLSGAAEQLRDKFVTLITTNGQVNMGVTVLKDSIQFLTDYMGALLDVVTPAIDIFLAYKSILLITKGVMWSYVAVTKSIAFWQGVATVATQQYATACFATTSGIRGMVAAQFLLEAGLVGSLGILGLVVGALSIFIARSKESADNAEFLRNKVDIVKNGFVQIKDPINQATLALQDYNQAVRDYNDGQNDVAKKEYQINKHGAFTQALIDIAASGFTTGVTGTQPIIVSDKPDERSYNIDHSQIQKDYAPADTQDGYTHSAQTPVVNLHVNVDKSGGVTVNNGNGANPVQVNQTSSYSNMNFSR